MKMDSKRTEKEKVIEQLMEGYEFATQLRVLLSSKPLVDDDHRCFNLTGSDSDSASADELVAKILRSFDKTILALESNFEPNTAAAVAATGEGSRNTSCDDSAAPGFYDRRCEDSGDSMKRLLGPNKGKRGCYKRKRKSQAWTVESATLEDAHAWRKYGQKEILNAKHPRSYFRCTHKYAQGCKATKQVQKLDDDPTKFQITYIGNHTCINHPINENLIKIDPSSVIIADSDNCTWSSKVQEDNSTLTVKDEETTKSDGVYNPHQKCPLEDLSLVWEDIIKFEDSETMFGCGETGSHHGPDMDHQFMFTGTNSQNFPDDLLNDNGELSFI